MPTCNQLRGAVTITGGTYPGTYSTRNSLSDGSYSYYLGGDSRPMNIPHFTVAPTGNGANVFSTFHITIYANGSNAGIWYDRGAYSNINLHNVPPDRQPAIKAEYNNNKAMYDTMALQFWNGVQ